MAFTELCVKAGGSNLNAGSRTGNSTEPGTSADFTYASGNWVAATGVFTVASGNPQTDGVAVGDMASVFADGSTVTGFVGRVTARTTTTITVDLTAKAGTAPTNGTGNRTLKIGGAWTGPNGSEAFPFGFIQNTLTNAAGDKPRVNFKNAATYNITAAMTHGTNTGPINFEGYASTYGDGGRATIDGGTSGASYVLLSITIGRISIKNFILQNNGATGSASGLVFSANTINCTAQGIVVHDVRGNGIEQLANSGDINLIECETYNCNQSNTASKAGIYLDGGTAERCVSHDNSGSNSSGFLLGAGSLTHMTTLLDCIADSNGSHGAFFNSVNGATARGCALYNNGGDGIRITNSQGPHLLIENSSLVKNGGYGINGQANTNSSGVIRNCAFGSGTQANTSGQTNVAGSVEVLGSITLAADVTPWTDPANGDFRNNLAAVKGTGRGTFTQTASSYAGTVSYPDIGLQHQDSGGPRFGLAGSGPSFRGAV